MQKWEYSVTVVAIGTKHAGRFFQVEWADSRQLSGVFEKTEEIPMPLAWLCNRYGDDGWELVGIDSSRRGQIILFFKRPQE
jgi:hypothetical protein